MKDFWSRVKSAVAPPERFLGINFGDETELFYSLAKRTAPEPLLLDIGAGSGRTLPGIMNMELQPTPTTDVAGDAMELPFRSGTLDGVVILNVLEHVRNPIQVVSEIRRVLKPEGAVYAVVPFVFPYHEAPMDNWRYTVSGLKILFASLGFRKVRCGFQKGPCSAYLRVSVHFWALFFSFNSLFLYKALRVLFTYLFSPFRFLDHIVYRYRLANLICSSVYFVGTRGEGAEKSAK